MRFKFKYCVSQEGVQVALFAILYGMWILEHPHIINKSDTYEMLRQFANSYYMGSLFILSGLIKIGGHVFERRSWRRVGIALIIGLWTVVFTSLILTGSSSTPVLFTPLMVLWAFRAAYHTR